MPTDLLFVNPGGQPGAYQRLAGEFTAVAPPAWAALLAEHARRAGLSAAIHDANLDGWDDTIAGRLLDALDPRLAVLLVAGHNPSASTQTMPAAGRIARDLKRLAPGLPLAMGGLHPSALPARTLAEEAVDFVVVGEGVPTLTMLRAHLDGRVGARDVPGLWHREDGAPRGNPPAPPAADLDATYPAYAWDLLPDLGRYRAHAMHCFDDFARSTREDFADVRAPYALVHTSLGCPFSCSYCCIHAFHGGHAVRDWSVGRVVAWLADLARRGVRHVRVEDELFLHAPARVARLCEAVTAAGLDLNLWVYGRVDTVPRTLLRTMRRAGVSWVCLGIESGSARVLADAGKRSAADTAGVVRAIQGEGISVLGNFLFGLPEDDLDSMRATFELARTLRCEFANFYTVMAYPGSPLHERCAATPGVLPASWAGYAQLGYETTPLPTRHLGAREVLRFRDEAFAAYFTDPDYLAMMREKFGPPVVRHLERMTALPLRRRLLE